MKAYNNKFITLDTTLADTKESKNNGIKQAINHVITEVTKVQQEFTLNNRKALKVAKNRVLDYIPTKEINSSLNRSYSIALTIVIRDLNIHIDLLTVSQIENLAKHGEVNSINDLFKEDKDTYALEVVAYLKSLKTRIVESKTFEKKSK